MPIRRTARDKSSSASWKSKNAFRPKAFPQIDTAATVSQVLDRWHAVIVAIRRETTAVDYRYS